MRPGHTPTGFLNNYDPLERIVCAAVHVKNVERHSDFNDFCAQPFNIKEGVVVCGWRHNSCFAVIARIWSINEPGNTFKFDDGFLTSHNRYVDRKEAADIARNAGQIKSDTKCLFSEDLY